MNDKLKDQKAIVTGASSGIGKSIALHLAKAGAIVGVNYNHGEERAIETVEQIKSEGGQAVALKGNVAIEEDVQEMFREFLSQYQTLDILICNSGIQKDSKFTDMTLDDWNEVINVNLTGQFLCMREAVKIFLAQSDTNQNCIGKIVSITSVHQLIPWAGHVNYAASKGGAEMLMKSVAQEYAPKRIRVNSIAPGAIKTNINTNAWQSIDAQKELLKLIPNRRIGSVDDVARTAVWLSSDDSDYINGTTVFVDGGMTLYPGFEDGG